MAAILQSSGDLIADRRYEWARGLIGEGDLAAAAELLAQAVEIAPGFAAAWFSLGEVCERQGDAAGAATAFRRARDADPRDALGAALRLVRLGSATPAAMPADYVRSLFDGYAPKFDAALTQNLGYRGPQRLLEALQRAGAPSRFAEALDLGCGTGLAGASFRPLCGRITGVDLSPGMLALARARNIYDRLVEAEALAFLRGEPRSSYDLVLAADVFAYVHDLMPLGAPLARVLGPGGFLAFSVETHDGEGVVLRDTLRYAHSAAHVREALSAGGLDVAVIEVVSVRTEKGAPVPGLVFVARK